MPKKLDHTALGQMAGYLFQPDRALYYLSELKDRNHFVSIELVDDVNVHQQDGTVILTEQDKHSIAQSNSSTFSDASKDLWRTLQIWVNMIKASVLEVDKVDFICCSNKSISKTSLISKISECKTDVKLDEVIQAAKNIQSEKNKSLSEKATLNKPTSSLEGLLTMINDVIDEEAIFRKLILKIQLTDEQDLLSINEKILNNINITEDNIHKDKILLQLKGWISERCKLLMNSKSDIKISKEQFNHAVQDALDAYKLSNISFSARRTLEETIEDSEISDKESSAFVQQLKTIKHRDIKNIILEAIVDFLCYEKEVVNIAKYAHITALDFKDFAEINKTRWKAVYNKYVIKELTGYTQEQLDDFAYKIYDDILDFQVKFKMYEIPISSSYFKNGSFHALADNLEIGWHPNWEKIFATHGVT